MKLKPLRNLTEALADDLLRQELGESWDVQSQVSLAAVLDKETEPLSDVCFDMLKSARYDFLIVNRESQAPALAIEVDGPTHAESHVAHRDTVKDALSVASGLRCAGSLSRRRAAWAIERRSSGLARSSGNDNASEVIIAGTRRTRFVH